jgi:type II secretory pathway pseudopilin PulG
MCVVLLIIGILLGVSMPAMRSAFTEQAMRDDSHHLALLVRTAMLRSDEQNRTYVIDLTGTSVALRVQQPASEAGDSTDTGRDQTVLPAEEGDFTFDPSNKFLVPNPDKTGEWIPVTATSWFFQPGDLCRVSRVRLSRGKAWMELSFNALTGNVEDETTYFP